MNVHQLIYTSCRRGRDGVNDGQQIFSYDECFPRQLLPSLAKTMSYRGPDLPVGIPLTEELVPSFPQSFSYRPLGDFGGFALNTYLGKDYMGPTGRFGNFLSHQIVLDGLEGYPVEFIGSAMFRSAMEFDEVNNPDPPSFLPQPDLSRGERVTRESVREFLSEDRWGTFTHMLACLLSLPAEGKRVIVHDDPEHVAQWIGALSYSLPPHCAAGVAFSTYEYNPLDADWRIVGAVAEGTKYDAMTNAAFVFDLVNGSAPQRRLPRSLEEFLEVGLLIAPDSLGPFYSFVEASFPAYRVCDETLYGAYALYELEQGVFSVESLAPACAMLSAHASDAQRTVFLERVLSGPIGVTLVSSLPDRALLLDLLNGTARDGRQLLEATFNAEGHLLDRADGHEATEIIWSNFNEQMVLRFSAQLPTIYRELASYGRLDELHALFTYSLRNGAGSLSPKEQLDEVLTVLGSHSAFPPFIDTYFTYAVKPAERAHLLRYIMREGIAFTRAGTLVREALVDIRYGPLEPAQVTFLGDVWQWVNASQIELRECGDLFHLRVGQVLTASAPPPQVVQSVKWVTDTARACGIRPVPEDRNFVAWVVPSLVWGSPTGIELRAVIDSLGLRLGEPLVEALWNVAFERFDANRWFTVAEFVFDSRSQRLVDSFAESVKKMSNRNLSDLQRVAQIRYANDTRGMADWEQLYAVSQETVLRSVKAWMRKRGEGRD